ncbi:rRNA maturation RNase YbeY [Tropicimonas sp. IMCC34043]|uniref:rRNA maturation RNase YbeY n=1 Tax=Tropicimonas sp. IMCC34043 TaxID=2248760 RepID=UPI000E24CB04|nr:rRNA maturation RNase YbeY [Tropicimonas sp. IMCC34043]
MTTEILFEDERWKVLALDDLARTASRQTLAHLGLDPEAYEFSLLACNDARIAELNRQFRGKPAPTNVLSWPAEDLAAEQPGGTPDLPEPDFPDEPIFLGDIAIAWETCSAEAETGGKPLEAHLTHLIVHGILHLLGYDHVREADAVLMERLEVEILVELGLPDPY